MDKLLFKKRSREINERSWHMSSILIVGHGPSVLSEELGAKIDQMPVIARFHNFQTKGFEKHVGTKTDIWCTSGFALLAQDIIERNGIKETIYTSMRATDAVYQTFKGFVPDATRLPRQHWKDTVKRMAFKRPSTGAACVYWFSKLYDQVYIHGFDHWSGEKAHYFGHIKFGKHSASKEKNFFY